MTIILTNDDGIDAPGIQALVKVVNNKNVIIAAPQEYQSSYGYQVTTHPPINLQHRSEVEYKIAGTPADCVTIPIKQICEDVKFVLSGINAGVNLGVDAYISGTVAAVREAAMHSIPGIAISLYPKSKLNYDRDLATKWTSEILANLLERPLEPGGFWNVNLPHLLLGDTDPEVVFFQPCTKPLPVNYRIEGDNFHYGDEDGKRFSEAH